MDSYIVRIYRRTEEPPELVGLVEKAGTKLKEHFHNSTELVKLLESGCSIQFSESACSQINNEIRT